MGEREPGPEAAAGSRSELPTLAEPESSSHASGLAPPPPGAPTFAPRDLLAGRYRVTRFLARGGMGEVYEAEDLELNARVALKTVRPEVAADPEALRRLKREALLARSVSHPSVCRVHEVGRHRGLIFLTMELLEGETLRARIDRGRLSPEEALPIVRQMAEGLEAAHRCGIVHRDFKSANVMLVRKGGAERVVVTDFGLAAAATGEGAESAERPRSRREGTPAYMSPEQARGEHAGPAADLYAFGVVLFEMVTGRLPFAGATPLAAALRRLAEEPPSPGAWVDLEPHWETAILRLLAPDPAQRFASALEAVRALEGKMTPARPPVRHTLPPERDAFVGREAELLELARRLGCGSRCLTLLGTGGVGKTRLARRLGWTSLDAWPGGVWFCDLSEARDRVDVVSAVAAGLGVPLGRDDPVVQLGHAIAGRGRTLVILDNFEQVIAHAEATVTRWVERATEAVFLVTSRERLGLAAEEVLAIEPLPAEGAGLDLFEHRAWSHFREFTLTESNREVVRDVVRLLDGLPLAIELAAARARSLAPEQIRERLADRFQFLLRAGSLPSRSSSLRVSIEWSWQLLRDWEKAVLAQASVFEGGFTLEAAEAVLDLTAWPEAPAVLDVVQSLVDKSLLRVRMAEGEPRFSMYVTVSAFARDKLAAGVVARAESAADPEQTVEERHGQHFAGLGKDEAIDGLNRFGGVEKRRRLALDLENLVLACRAAISRGDGETAAWAYRAACEVLAVKGPSDAGVDLGLELLGMDGLSLPAQAAVLDACGGISEFAGRVDDARRHLERALVLFREVGDRRGEGRTLCNLGNLHRQEGRTEEARERLERALAINRETEDRRNEGITLAHLGLLDRADSRMGETLEYFKRALAVHREVGDRRAEGIGLLNLAIHHGEAGRPDLRQECNELALAILREVGDRRYEGIVLGNMGNLCGSQGRLAEAREHFERALVIHRECGSRCFEGYVMGSLGVLDHEENRMEEAREHLEEAIARFREVHHFRAEGLALMNLASHHAAQGRGLEAREALARGEAPMRDGGELATAIFLCARGQVECLEGDAPGAHATLAEAEALAGSFGASATTEVGRCLTKLRQALASAT